MVLCDSLVFFLNFWLQRTYFLVPLRVSYNKVLLYTAFSSGACLTDVGILVQYMYSRTIHCLVNWSYTAKSTLADQETDTQMVDKRM